MRIKNPLLGIVKGNREVSGKEQSESDESWRSRPPLSTPETVAPPPPPLPEPKVEVAVEPAITVEAACALMKAFPTMPSEERRQTAIRTAILAKAEPESFLAEAAQEKARYAAARETQEKLFENQLAQIVASVDALWEKRDRLTEYHQRAMLDVEARLTTLDQLIYCLTHEETVEPDVVAEVPAPLPPEPVEEEEEAMVVVLPFKPSSLEGDEDDEGEARPANRRRLYQKAA